MADAEGRFTLGGDVDVAPCWALDWRDRVSALAPGYRMAEPRRLADLERTAITLTPIRYALELEPCATEIQSRHRLTLEHEPGPQWQAAAAALRSAPVRAGELPGVFMRIPGAAFTDVVVLAPNVTGTRVAC